MKPNNSLYNKQIEISSGIVITIGFLVICGWVFDISAFKSIIPDYTSMKFNTALSFVLVSTSIYLQFFDSNKKRVLLWKAIGLIVLVISTLTLFQAVFNFDFKIDQVFYPDLDAIRKQNPYPGRMSTSTAFCFSLLALFSLSMGSKNRTVQALLQILLHIITLISFIAIVGYLLGVPSFYNLSFITSMAIHTSFCFLLISLSSSLIYPTVGLAGLFTGTRIGNIMARKLFLQIVFAILVLSYIRIISDRFQIVTVEFGIALFAISFILTSLFLIWRTAKALNFIDYQKEQFETSLSQMSMILDSTPDPMIVFDEKEIILLSNKQLELVFGYSKNEIIGQKIETLVPSRHKGKFENLRDSFSKSSQTRAMGFGQDLYAVKKNGDELSVEISLSPIKLGDKTWVSAAIRDVSERRENEEKHNRLSERLFIATNTSGIGIWEYDLVNNVLEWDDVMFQISGVAKDSFSGAYGAWQNGLHPDDRTQAEKDLQMAISGEKEFDTEFRIVWPDQSIHFIKARANVQRDATGNAFRIIGTTWDITNQKLAEAEINESNKRNRIFVEQAPHAIAMFDKNMCYMSASQQWVKDYNLSGKQLIGQSHYEIFPEIGDDWKKIHQECLQGAINQVDEACFERADGTEQWITWDVRPWYISDKNIGGLIMYTADITHIKKKDADKRRIEEILDRTSEVARIGTWEVDLISDKILWSRVTKEIHEVPQDYEPELQGAINFFKEGESRSKIQQAVTEAIEKGTPYDVEVELITAKGNAVWARAIGQSEFLKGKCKRLYGVFQDINKIKRAELELNKANEELKAIFNSGYVSIIRTNTEGLITHFNRGAEVLLQYSADEMINLKTPAVLHVKEEVIARGQELTKLLGREISGFDVFFELAKEGQYESREWTYVRKDRSTFPVQLIVTAIKNNKNEIIGFLGVAADITERKKVENEIRSLLSITEKQNDRLKNFAHIVSHNLRSHSGGISGLIELLQLEYPDFASNELLTLLNTSSQNLKQTVEDLTEVVKVNLTNEELQHIQLSKVIEKNIKSLSSQISRAGIKILNEIPNAIQIQGIPAYVDSIVLNMITNVIKYKSEDRESFLRIYYEEKSTSLTLFFQDNGLGIDLKKHGDKLFGMYKTFHRHDDSRGIGLFLTKNQVESMGGKITVESEVNIGTTFKITFKK